MQLNGIEGGQNHSGVVTLPGNELRQRILDLISCKLFTATLKRENEKKRACTVHVEGNEYEGNICWKALTEYWLGVDFRTVFKLLLGIQVT
jgi:hypothetical protein